MIKIINPQTRHLFLPRIMTYLVLGLLILILITNWKKILTKLSLTKNNWRELDLVKNKKMFWSNLGLLFGYAIALNLVGFIASSIIYIFLSILLFYNSLSKKMILTATITSLLVTIVIWLLFGVVLNITLP